MLGPESGKVDQYWNQIEPLFGQRIEHAATIFRILRALQDACFGQRLQAIGQNVGGDPFSRFLELREAPLALKLKGLDYETVAFDGFEDREAVIEVSGQPLTPVLLDGERSIYDSFAILRYLDANFPGPRLYSADRAEQQKIQEWERFGYQLGGPLGMVAGQAFSGEIDDQATAEAQALWDSVPQPLEDALAGSPYLMGDAPTAADLSLAPFLRYTVSNPEDFPEGSPVRFVAERLRLGAHFPNTLAWIERVMALDQETVAS